MLQRTSLLALFLTIAVAQQTPVIGGSCKLGSADVQIGGKQTQFFLKCEATSESADGEGVWVVKSRAAASSAPAPAPVPQENTQPQQRPTITLSKQRSNICEQDNGARESEQCAVSATCLQATIETPTSFLQCEQTSLRWMKKSCQEGYIFNFEQQACIVPKRAAGSQHRQQAAVSGLVCTFSSCSNSNPCSSGTCNNGYCCSSGSSNSQPIILAAPASSNCIGCGAQAAPQIITIPQSSCPGGAIAYGTCSTGYCATGYSCVQGSCCPSYSQPAQSISVYTCPGGGNSVGSCISGGCATGYTCTSSNTCCPANNPFVCPDGTQAVGGCVNGLCGSGYSCSNGLCCSSTSSQPKCLDGSPAVGACMPSCTGDACGRTTVSYYCGAGYTCTTGNICCPVNSCPDGGEPIGPPVNGYCPTGYVLQGSQCCSIVNPCLDGETNIGQAINGFCPTGYTERSGYCCQAEATTVLGFAQPCIEAVQIGFCPAGAVEGDACGGRLGFGCRSDAEDANGEMTCCPMFDYTDVNAQAGPAILDADGVLTCVDPDTVPLNYPAAPDGPACFFYTTGVPGLCAAATEIGPCFNDLCPDGSTCMLNVQRCCPTTTAFSRLRSTKPKGRVSKPRSALAAAIREAICPNGESPASACMNDLCGAGLECIDDVCCPAGHPSVGFGKTNFNSFNNFNNNNNNNNNDNGNINNGFATTSRPKRFCANGAEAASSCFADGTCGEGLVCVIGLCCGTAAPPPPPRTAAPSKLRGAVRTSSNKPIGASCTTGTQCAGHTEGLAKCEKRVCRCTSAAYAQGVACVRRKKLMFNDEPVPVESNVDTNTLLA